MLWYFDKTLYNIWQRDLLASAYFQNWIFWRFSCKISWFLQQTSGFLLNLGNNGFVSFNLQGANKPQSVCFFKYTICNIGLRISSHIDSDNKNFNRSTKLYFTHYSCAVIILFNTGLYKSAFSIYSFGKLVFVSFWAFLCFLSVMCRIWCNLHKHLYDYFLSTLCFCSQKLERIYKNRSRHRRLSKLLIKNMPPENFWAFEF